MPKLRSQPVLFALGAALFWATWPVFALVATPAPPFFILTVAAVTGFAVSGATFALRGKARDFLAIPLKTQVTVASGLLGTNGFFLFALPRIGAAEANIIAFLWPVLLILILSLRDGIRLKKIQKVGTVLGFAGAAVAIGPTFSKGFDPAGILLAFLGGLSYALYSAAQVGSSESRDVVGPSLGLLAVVAFGLHLLTETQIPLGQTNWLAIGCIGVFSLTLSNSFWGKAIQTGDLASISSIPYLTPLISLLLLAGLGVETVSGPVVIGGVLVVTGAFAASIPPQILRRLLIYNKK
jgi:drug/metabolite transporter (DMT)-like permease